MTSGGLVEELIDVETVESARALARTISLSSVSSYILNSYQIPRLESCG